MKLTSELLKIKNFIIKNCRKKNNLYNHLVFTSKSSCKNKILILTRVKNENIYSYINEAIKKNIKAIITDKKIDNRKINAELPILYSKNLSTNLNMFLDHIYSYPLKNKILIGVTGTDGKTSTVNYLAQSLSNEIIKKRVGIISSSGNGVYPTLKKTAYTTPPSHILYKNFKMFNKSKVDIIIIECSSHGLDQGRLNNINFDTSIFTNITSDHLDYHITKSNYVKAKLRLVKQTSKNIYINNDCTNLKKIKKNRNIKLIKYNFTEKRNESLKDIIYPKDLLTKYLSNNYEINKESLSIILRRLKPIKGRYTYLSKLDKKVIIDSAHTSAAFHTILKYISTVEEFRKESLKLIIVFGCGGERDKTKRKKMGTIASKYSDRIYLTNDNPRGEDPMSIITQISQGIIDKSIITVSLDRRLAIKRALSEASKKHLVLISGKGNEDYIEEMSKKVPHNDIKYVKMLLG
tara:strand:+ start:2057 stop:3445 length:1389 start_codon:yes stop_codon:yes gene_type:complete